MCVFGGFCSGRFFFVGCFFYILWRSTTNNLWRSKNMLVGLVLRGFLFPNIRKTGATLKIPLLRLYIKIFHQTPIFLGYKYGQIPILNYVTWDVLPKSSQPNGSGWVFHLIDTSLTAQPSTWLKHAKTVVVKHLYQVLRAKIRFFLRDFRQGFWQDVLYKMRAY